MLLAGQEEATAAEGGEFEAPEGPSEMKSESLSTAAAAAIAARAAAAARLREEEQKRRLLEEEAVGVPHLSLFLTNSSSSSDASMCPHLRLSCERCKKGPALSLSVLMQCPF